MSTAGSVLSVLRWPLGTDPGLDSENAVVARPNSGNRYSRCRCGRRWTGLSQCHCTACHRHFSSLGPFDMHRRDGRCNDPASLVRKDGSPSMTQTDGELGALWSVRDDRPAPEHWIACSRSQS